MIQCVHPAQDIAAHPAIRNATFVCEAYGCTAAIFETKSHGNGTISVYCAGDRACRDMNLKIEANNTSMIDYFATLHCYVDNSCELMKIQSDMTVGIYINMYKYSPNVLISIQDMQQINVTCGNVQDHRYVRYDVFDIKTDAEILDSARNEYAINHLPCEGITVDCSLDESFIRSCKYEYQVIALNNSEFITDPDALCYWMDISDILNPVCIGECGRNLTLFQRNASLDFEIAIDTSNQSSVQLMSKCNSFFGDINTTIDTLSDIDSIFENIFKIVFNSFEIYDMITGPASSLSNGERGLNCTNLRHFEIIYLTVRMSVLSGIEADEDFDDLWKRQDFIQPVEELLSLYFGVPVSIFQQNKLNEFVGPWKNEYVYGIIGTSLFIIFCILFIIYYNHRRKLHRLQLLTSHIFIITNIPTS